MEYYKKKDMLMVHRDMFDRLIIDRAAQSAFDLWHFELKPKSEKRRAIEMRLIGVIEQLVPNTFRFFKNTEDNETSANYIFEAVY